MLDGVKYFNPVVENWGVESQQREIEARQNCDVCLYVITPKMSGVYSIAEAVDDSNKRPEKTVFCLLNQDDFGGSGDTVSVTEGQIKSLFMVWKMIESNGGKVFTDLSEVAAYLNGLANEQV
jgi:hypothetical protein